MGSSSPPAPDGGIKIHWSEKPMSPVECHRKYLKSSLLFSVERGHRKNYASTIRQGQGTMISIRRYDTRARWAFVNKSCAPLLRICVIWDYI